MQDLFRIPDLGNFASDCGLRALSHCSDTRFEVGAAGVHSISATGDGKVEFIGFEDHSLAYVHSALGYSAYYPVHPASLQRPVKAVLMDLDGTSVHSEAFWIWIIEQSTASLLKDPDFKLEESDTPYVSGHSVSEHLQYCITKYCPDKTLEEARAYYFEHTRRELKEVLEGRGKADMFQVTPGLQDFLTALKERKIKIALVTSGLYEKAWPEVVSAFRSLTLGAAEDFYDAIITAGFPLEKGAAGTLGELSPKPHPWLYAEACRIGLGIPFEQRSQVLGIEDSGAGVCSVRLAGFSVAGIGGGNIMQSGVRALCDCYAEDFTEILAYIDG